MAMRRTQRGGPVPAGGAGAREGSRLVTPATSKSMGQQMRSMMTPSRPGRARLMQERLGADFFREAWAELRKVHWPTRQQARNLTALVIGVSLAIGMIMGGMDYLFEKIFEFVLQVR